MADYQEVRVRLTNTQLSKLICSKKNKKGLTWKLNSKNFEGENCQMNYWQNFK